MISKVRSLILGKHPYNTVFNYNWVNIRPMIRTFRKLKHYFRGTIVDLGAGLSPYYELVATRDGNYIAVDRFSELPKHTSTGPKPVAGDLQHLPFLDESVDTVFCAQVISQLMHPEDAIHEIARILRSSGAAILSAPSTSPIHSEPYDLYRFTPDGLKGMLERAGLKVLEQYTQGQMFSSFALNLAMTLVLTPMKSGQEMKLRENMQLLFAPLIGVVNLSAVFLDWIFPFNRTPVNFILVAIKGQKL